MITKLSEKVKHNVVTVANVAFIFALLMVFCVVVNYSLIIPFLLLALGLHLYVFKRLRSSAYLQLALLLTVLIFAAHAIDQYTTASVYLIPVASVAMLTTLLFKDVQLSVLMAFVSSMIITLILGGDFSMLLTFMLGSIIGSYAVRDGRTRGQIISAGLFVSVVHVICLVLFFPNPRYLLTQSFAQTHIYPLIANGFIAAFVITATLKIFEYLFGVLTNFSLLELSDFNQPLLKRMILEAPGTYHHSLVVSNLSEAAAEAIGAHGLLARVGSYYHDIGKMDKAEYFTENQNLDMVNKHDAVEPTISKLIILNHVKEGIDLAQKYKLSHEIVDFIEQHHGTSLVFYFYQKALVDAAHGEEVDEEQFRYPGPKPQTRETAIVLLADSVEGAVRSLDEKTPPRIEEIVKKIINNKFIDGQLDECPLTLKEIEKISSTFTRILSSLYHSRVKYPELKAASARSAKGASDAVENGAG